MQYKVLKVAELKPFPIRDIRANVVSKLTERIKEGYNPARPLSVVKDNGSYIVADGNHRLHVLRELGVEEVPCLIRDGDPYRLAVECNADEDTYAPMDLFDWLDVIANLKGCGHKGVDIAEKFGWSVQKVSDYNNALEKTSAEVLVLAKTWQNGRAEKKSAVADFTEGWFRNSGLYELQAQYQMQLMEWFIENKCKPGTAKVNEKAAYLLGIQEQVELVNEKLSPELNANELLVAVKRGEYTTKRLQEVINRLNEGAKNKALFGVDALEELRKLPANSIDLVVTDPPYGIEFQPTRKTKNPAFKDNAGMVFDYLEEVFTELKRVCKANAHIYVFSGYTHAFKFKEMLERHFSVQENWLTWVKNNHTMCDFKKQYASKYEVIWFCKMPNGNERQLNSGCSPDVLEYAIPQNKYHDCQKPIELLQYLIENSSGKGEVILDPFAGSGSTLIAAAKCGRYYIGFELEKSYEPPFKRFLGDVVP